MSTRCWVTILRAMGRSYPEPIDLDAVCRHTGLNDAKVRRELWGVVGRVYVEVRTGLRSRVASRHREFMSTGCLPAVPSPPVRPANDAHIVQRWR